MNEAVVVAIIGAVGAVLGAYLGSTKAIAVMEERIINLKEDFAKLSAKVMQHNNLVERIVIVEQSTKLAHQRLDEIRKDKSE